MSNRRKLRNRIIERANGSAPQLVRPHFPGVEVAAWSDAPPAQYPPDTVTMVKGLLELGDRLARIDVYRCDTCAGLTVTRMTHPGVTPKVIDHNRFSHDTRCPGTTFSAGYPDDVPADWAPSHEFYRPSESELRRLPDEYIDHVLRGGLLLRLLPLEATR